MNNPGSIHIPILDSMRAIAALSVCLFHFVCTTTGYIQTDLLLNVFNYGQYGVMLFFVISGFVIPWAMYHAGYGYRHFFLFFLKRLARLEPPYLVSIILILAFLFVKAKYFANGPGEFVINWKQVALHLGYLIPFTSGYTWLNNVYWSLAIEFQYYLVIAILFIPLFRKMNIMRFGIYLMVLAGSFFSGHHFIPYWLPLFLVGCVLCQYKLKLISNVEFYAMQGVLLIFGIWHYNLVTAITGLLLVIFVLFFSEIKVPVLDSLGKISYSLYLIHPVIGSSVINVLSHRMTSPLEKFLCICIGIAATLICSWIHYFLVERPSKKLSSSVNYTT